METQMKILVVDDENDIRLSLSEILEEEGYRAVTAPTAAAAQEEAARGVDLVLLDIKLGEDNGIDLLKSLKKQWPGLPVIMISGHGTVALAAKAFKAGAYDFLEKPLRLVQVRTCVRNALEKLKLQKQLARQGLDGYTPVYRSKAMGDLFAQAQKLSFIREPVIIIGPSGSGKELVARALHYGGSRVRGAFIPTNAPSLPINLAEDELFGHVKGAFTGADRDREGSLAAADGGTLFLDEIADMDPGIQAKLLRVLEDGSFTRLGSTTPQTVDVRLVCATHKNIEELVDQGTFRQDLWYRISAFIIRVPSLAQRKEDIPVLAEHFLTLTAEEMGITRKFTTGALNALQKMELPGNVRELRHLVARLSVYSSGDSIDVNDINAVSAGHPVTGSPAGPEAGKYQSLEFKAAREEFEKDYLKAILKKNRGNITATANAIGMAQSNLSRKLKELKLR